MEPATLVVFFYGLFSLIGGVIGHLKAKSKASLIAGSLSGMALLACAYGLKIGNNMAPFVSLGIAFLLGARFLGTWFKTRRLMPDFLMILFSLAVFVSVGLKLMRG